MLDQGNRTFISSVVFVDIVSYSKKSVSEQITIKDRFTTLLSEALKDTAPEQRIILDTGDGAAMSFLGDPEDALFVAMHMRDVLKRAAIEQGITTQILSDPETAVDASDLRVRIGINLGPVKLVRDFNSQPNIVGDGINVAQRIMSFAAPGQVVVSRSYFDVVSVISEEYAKLFKYEGSRTDKHVREHEIYVVGDSIAAFNQAKAGMADRAAATNPRVPLPGDSLAAAEAATEHAPTVPFLQDGKKLAWTGAALLAVVVSLFGIHVGSRSGAKPVDVVTSAAPKNVAPPVTAQTVPPPPATTTPAAETPKSPTSAVMPPAKTSGTPALAAPPGATIPPLATKLPAEGKPQTSTEATASKPATLTFDLKPWGAVFLDGKALGDSPPLKVFQLPAGRHKLEVKNGNLPPFVTSVDLKPGETLNIRHHF